MATRAQPDDDAVTPLLLTSRVPAWAHGQSLVQYLASRFPYRDVAGWQRELMAGRFAVDGRPADAATRLASGQRLDYTNPHREPEVDLDVPVLVRDDRWLVVDKPAMLPCHADGAFIRHTLVHQVTLTEGRVRLVHRLDRETSGVMILARSRAAHRELDEQFRVGTVEKCYLAVVRGSVTADFVCDGAIGRAPDSAVSLRRAVVADDSPDARPARTEFEVVLPMADRTLLRCRPRTGRTHQIRVHLEHCGHPLLGDVLYGRRDADYLAFVEHVKASGPARRQDPGAPGRQLLHAESLTLTPPGAVGRRTFHAPPPADFARWARPGDLG